MSFTIPTLAENVERARTAFRAWLKGTDAWLWPNNIGPTAKVIGGKTHELFGYLDYVQKEKHAHTASEDGLADHGKEFGVPRRPAAPASGTVTIVTSGQKMVNAGDRFRRLDGFEYSASASGSIATAGQFTLPVIATTDGLNGNAIAGTELTDITDASGVVSVTVADDGIVGGDDVEDVESWRSRILFRKRNPIQGGAPSDYVTWAMEVSGVTRVFIEPLYAGNGTVRIFILMDDRYDNGIPPQFEIDRVQDHLALYAPAGALYTAAAPAPLPVPVTVADLSPATEDVREAVRDEIRAAFRRHAVVAGIATAHPSMPYLAIPFTFSKSWIAEAVSVATGEDRHVLQAPDADIAVPTASIPVPGDISFPDDAG